MTSDLGPFADSADDRPPLTRTSGGAHRPDGWTPLVLDLYLEVVVSDEPTAVHHATWGSIKALFR